VVYDLNDRHLAKVRLYDTLRNTDGGFSLGKERPVIYPGELDFVIMTRTNALNRTNAYTARLDLSHEFDGFGNG
jgi:hypothetical protein